MSELLRPINRAELVNGGSIIKEGDIFKLQYKLLGADNNPVDLAGKTIGVKIASNAGVVYETTATSVGKGIIEFTVDKNIGYGDMRIELKVTQGTSEIQKFPAESWLRIRITPSIDNIEFSGITTITVNQLKEELRQIQSTYEKMTDSKIATIDSKATAAEKKSDDALAEAGSAKKTSDSVRKEFDAVVERETDSDAMSRQAAVNSEGVDKKNLKARLDDDYKKVTQQLAETVKKDEVNALATNKADKDKFDDFKAGTGFSLAYIQSKYNLAPIPPTIIIENLWKLENTALGGLSETTGNVSAHATNRTSDFVKIIGGENYSLFAQRQFKVVFYDVNKKFISGYGWQSTNKAITFLAPNNTEYMRMTLAIGSSDVPENVQFIANIGTTIMNPNEEGSVFDGGFWNEVPTPPLRENTVKTHHLNNNSVTIEKLSAEVSDIISPTRIYFHNLWNLENTVLGSLSETSGNVSDHATNRTSDFTPIESNRPYSFLAQKSTFKVVFYDANKKFISGYGWNSQVGLKYTYTPPNGARYVRFTVQHLDHNTFIANIGTEIMKPDDEGMIYYDSFWENQPNGAVRENNLSKDLLDLIKNAKSIAEQPFPKKLKFKEISNGWSEVNHLSQDGEVVYFKRGRVVEQSLDDGDTIVTAFTLPAEIPSIQAIRDLADGELLISTTRADDTGALNSKIFKTVGYNRKNPGNTQVVQVLEAIATQANIYSSWGLEAHDNIALASEYGLRGDEGARRVYLSTDYGGTWKVIFDQKTTTATIPGAPTWTTSAHLHTVHYDRYWERIWLVTGDSPNTATYYSDDMGQSWKYVPNSGVVQYTGIVSYPEGVVFGSDRNPNGLHVWKRTENKSDVVRIDTLKTVNNETVITHVFQRAFRRYTEKNELSLFPATRVDAFAGVYSSVLMGFTGINNPHLLYELPFNGLGMYVAVGVTARGNILTSYQDVNHKILRAKAPLWE